MPTSAGASTPTTAETAPGRPTGWTITGTCYAKSRAFESTKRWACHAHRFAMWALWLAGSSILLVIEIRPPEFHALRAQWPSYVAYLVSFLTIGVIRLNHHRVFEQVARVDGPLLLLNLNLLLWTELVPFPTAVVAEHLGDGGEAAQTAAALYCGVLLVMGLAFGALFAWVTHDDRRAVTAGP
jgi:hypothetical protein